MPQRPAPRVDLAKLAARARAQRCPVAPSVEAVQATPESVPEPPKAPEPPPPAAPGDSVLDVAEGARAALERAMADPAVRGSSMRFVMGTSAAHVGVIEADARDRARMMVQMREALAEAREPVPAERWEAWKAELVRAMAEAHTRIEALHADVGARAEAGAAAGFRSAAEAVVRRLDRAQVRALAGFGLVFGLACAALGAGATLAVVERQVVVAEAGLALGLREARAWAEVIRANPDPRVALSNDRVRVARNGCEYWEGTGLWRKCAGPAAPR